MLSVVARRSAGLAAVRGARAGVVLRGGSVGGGAGGLGRGPAAAGALVPAGVRYQHAGMTQNVMPRLSLTAHGVR